VCAELPQAVRKSCAAPVGVNRDGALPCELIILRLIPEQQHDELKLPLLLRDLMLLVQDIHGLELSLPFAHQLLQAQGGVQSIFFTWSVLFHVGDMSSSVLV